MSQPEQEQTHHAMLVLWGQYAQQLGLIEALESIPLRQKKRAHSPQTKVIEFLVATLAGLPYLKDISRAAHPLDQDQAVARAWGQPAWADYSGVSRTLSQLSMDEARQIVAALDEISQPLIDQEINRALTQTDSLIWDGDLTGRPVSNSSVTYPNVAYGYMSDGVQLGYQAAMVSMHSPTYGRLWLSTTAHPGDTVSCTQAEALALAAEAKTGVRPRRRTELLAQRLEQVERQLQVTLDQWRQAEQALRQAKQNLMETVQNSEYLHNVVTALEADCQSHQRPERPHSKLAKARGRLDIQKRRCIRRRQALEKAQRRVEKKQARLQEIQQQVAVLAHRLRRFEQENATNPMPLEIILRLDAGFGSLENIALLIEMGYELYTKPQSYSVTEGLKKEIAADTPWVRVGDNAEMVAWSGKMLPNFPYPLDVALERFYTGSTVKHSALLHYGKHPVTSNLGGWFEDYNARQTIEAGIKEGKGVFTMHHFKVRSEAGLFLQEHFAAFAANFVRWAAHWLSTQCILQDPFQPTLSSVKAMVQVAAHTSAWVIWQPQGCLLRFSDHSIFAGLSFQAQDWSFQLPLPLFKNEVFSPP